MKLRDLLDDILEKNVLGEVAGYMWTIEFQKCGLPHCHMLFILQKDPEYYDKFVYAELPNLQTQPILFQHVTKNMLHGPCRRDKPNATCMVDGKCKKHFPKVFQENTLHSYNGYPLYQCRNNGFTFTKSNVELDNCSVVPYSPFFLVKYRGHCNVEICASEQEKFYLRALLYHIPRATSFEDMRTINGVVCHSYKETAMKLGLVHDDREYYRTMEFANVSATPYQM
ncbi:uncharacterized protein LOC128247073 [Octopus bimaculoides]|uniref:uncharacterized protein LOC128247073 n=1 Tax=Octopus bimaculoides TaxID=37653 RepID=UPI0022E3DA69|nr:uncharacterized protein LOC128247073 [Octopus bimaculoides]